MRARRLSVDRERPARRRRRRPPVPWIVAVAVAAVLVGTSVATSGVQPGRSGRQPPEHCAPSRPAGRALAAAPPPVATTAAPPAIGVYSGPVDPNGAATFGAAAGTPVTMALDFLDGSSWSTLSDATWASEQWGGSPFPVVWGVPMLPDRGASLAQGAAGSYDSEFVALAQSLVAEGQGSATLLLGWDPNVPGTAWSVTSPAGAAQYVAYWDRITAAMGSVPGTAFTFAWDVDGGQHAVPPTALYPGRAEVDVVATDVFDLTTSAPAPSERWATIADQPYGPNWFASFASAQGRPLLLAKWGVVPTTFPGGGGDDPTFVRDSLTWASAHGASVVVWDAGNWSISGGAFPRSLTTLRAVLHPAAAGAQPAPAASQSRSPGGTGATLPGADDPSRSTCTFERDARRTAPGRAARTVAADPT